MSYKSTFLLRCLAAVVLIGGSSSKLCADGANLLNGDFESGTTVDNPWAGVATNGNLQVFTGTQMAVNDEGRVGNFAFSPSVAVGDLNGDGLPDLVVADPRGFFWFYPNSGKPNAPVFTHGEIIPVWLGKDPYVGDVVPRIQLIDLDGKGTLSIVAGNYYGELYFIHNRGTSTQPDFRMPDDRSQLEVPTHRDNLLWCNYLTPFLYDWTGTGVLDLVIGDGSYSANSIFLLRNQGSNNRPIFNEEHMIKMIPGMGREHLTPQVVDWNGDGKPDIICGDRTGYISVYLNQSIDKDGPPVFDKDNPIHLSIGTTTSFGAFTTVCVADMNGDKLPDLVTGKTDGSLYYAVNTGKPGAPKFDALTQIKGTPVYPTVIAPATWVIDRVNPFGAPYELLECVNAQIEPGFKPPPPPDFTGKGALKFSIVQPQNPVFKTSYYPLLDPDIQYQDLHRTINYSPKVPITTDTRYTISFWVRTTGSVSNMYWMFSGYQKDKGGGDHYPSAEQNFDAGESWTKITQDFRIDTQTETRNEDITTRLQFFWDGDGTVYFDGFQLKKNN